MSSTIVRIYNKTQNLMVRVNYYKGKKHGEEKIYSHTQLHRINFYNDGNLIKTHYYKDHRIVDYIWYKYSNDSE